MDRSWGTVRTTRGELAVEQDALHHHTTPRKSVTGELARYRDGTLRRRLRAVGAIIALLLLPVMAALQLWTAADAAFELSLLVPVLAVATTAAQLWETYLRDTRVPRTAVEGLELDPDERELTIRHTHDDSRLPTLEAGPRTETVKLPSDDDLQDARTLFRTVGLTEEFAPVADETGTEYRVETRNGVVFCEACGSQVSPADDRCRSCDEQIRVEKAVETA